MSNTQQPQNGFSLGRGNTLSNYQSRMAQFLSPYQANQPVQRQYQNSMANFLSPYQTQPNPQANSVVPQGANAADILGSLNNQAATPGDVLNSLGQNRTTMDIRADQLNYQQNHGLNNLFGAQEGDLLYDDPNKGWWDTKYGEAASKDAFGDPLKGTDDTLGDVDFMGDVASGVGIAKDLGNMYLGWQTLGIAKDQNKLSKQAYQDSKEMTYAQYNTQRLNQLQNYGSSNMKELIA